MGFMRFRGSRQTPLVFIAVCLSVVVASSSCTGADPKGLAAAADVGPPVGTWADESAELGALSFSQQPLWTTQDHPGLSAHSEVDFDGELIIVHDEDQLVVADAATGTAHWSLNSGDELSGGEGAEWHPMAKVVDTDAGKVILVETIRDACEHTSASCSPNESALHKERGIAALSVSDGSVLWFTPILPSVVSLDEEHGGPALRLQFANASTALVAVAPLNGFSGQPVPTESVHSVALDVTTGAVSWVAQGAWPVSIAGDTVLAVDSAVLPRAGLGLQRTVAAGTVVGLDVGSGAKSWTYADEGVSDVVLSVGGYALVRSSPTEDQPGTAFNMIDSSTGETVEEIGGQVSSCGTDETSQASCILDGPTGPATDHLMTFDADTAEVTVGAAKPPGSPTSVLDVTAGYTFVGGHGTGTCHATDPTGGDRGGALPGDFLGMSDKYAVFATGEFDQPKSGFVVHQVLS